MRYMKLGSPIFMYVYEGGNYLHHIREREKEREREIERERKRERERERWRERWRERERERERGRERERCAKSSLCYRSTKGTTDVRSTLCILIGCRGCQALAHRAVLLLNLTRKRIKK